MAWYISVHMIQESAAFEQYLVAREEGGKMQDYVQVRSVNKQNHQV